MCWFDGNVNFFCGGKWQRNKKKERIEKKNHTFADWPKTPQHNWQTKREESKFQWKLLLNIDDDDNNNWIRCLFPCTTHVIYYFCCICQWDNRRKLHAITHENKFKSCTDDTVVCCAMLTIQFPKEKWNEENTHEFLFRMTDFVWIFVGLRFESLSCAHTHTQTHTVLFHSNPWDFFCLFYYLNFTFPN